MTAASVYETSAATSGCCGDRLYRIPGTCHSKSSFVLRKRKLELELLKGALKGVVQILLFLGCIRRAETAGLRGSDFGEKGVLCGRRQASPGQARWG